MQQYDTEALRARLESIRHRIQEAAIRSGRDPSGVRIVAVTKTHPTDAIVAAFQAGLRDFGENRVQEAVSKFSQLPMLMKAEQLNQIHKHLIGHLQTNKAKVAVKVFDIIHSVDSIKLAEELEKHCRSIGKTVDILIQVNVSGEETKSGVAPQDVFSLVNFIVTNCEHLIVQGYMTIAPLTATPEKARPHFRRLREIRDEMHAHFQDAPRYHGKELSMGMTNDYEVAVEEGSTMVRIGTALFGERSA
jgi:pyridoxal phosphate enzyme (YggS family)